MWLSPDSSLFSILYLLILGSIVCAALLFFYYKREPTFGMTSLYITLGVFLHMADVLASLMPLSLGWEIRTNPGSAILFPATLLIVLLLYKQKTADELKKLCFVLISVNILIALVSFALSVFANERFFGQPELGQLQKVFSAENSVGVIVSAILLVIDIVIILSVCDGLDSQPSWLQLVVPLLTALWFDSAGFAAMRWGLFDEPLGATMYSHLVCKTVVGLLYATLLWVYLRVFEINDIPNTANVKGVFWNFLRYFLFNREAYKEIHRRIDTDPATGLDMNLQRSLEQYTSTEFKTNGPGLTLYMLKIMEYPDIRKRLDAAQFTAIREAFGRVPGRPFIYNNREGIFAIIFHQKVDVREMRRCLDQSLAMQEELGITGRVRRWPTSTGRLELVDAVKYLNPYGASWPSSRQLLKEMKHDLLSEQHDWELSRKRPGGPPEGEMVGAGVGRTETWAPEQDDGTSPRMQPAPADPGRAIQGGESRQPEPAVADRTAVEIATGIVTTYQGHIDAIRDGIAFLDLETEDEEALEIEWSAAELKALGIREGSPFLLTTREFPATRQSSGRMEFHFEPDDPGSLSPETLKDIEELKSYYASTGALDG